MTATATAVQQDVSAAFPLQPVAFVNLQQSRPSGGALAAAAYVELRQPITFGYLPLLKSYLDPSQLASFDGVGSSNFRPKPPQLVSLGQPETANALAPARQAAPALSNPDAPVAERRTALVRRSDIASVRSLMSPIVRIQFTEPVLAPMAHTLFCLKNRSDCKVHNIVFRGGPLKLTAERWTELARVNTEVNHSITPKRDTEWLAGHGWQISPKSGDCNDYAVTKRHELLELGWPERDLLLSEVVTSRGEHHLVLVARTSDGDFVADNLTPGIRSWSKAPYQWVRIQSPGNPTFWSTVARTTVWAKVSGLTNPES